MNVLLYLLVVLAVMALAVWALNRRAHARLPTIEQFQRYVEAGPDSYRYLARLFAPEDFSFLEGARGGGPGFVRRLRGERRRVMRLLLGDLRVDFEALMALGSMLSGVSSAREDGYSASLTHQGARFYTLYGLLYLSSFWPAAVPLRLGPAPLWEQVKALRSSTQTLMRSLTASDMIELQKILGL